MKIMILICSSAFLLLSGTAVAAEGSNQGKTWGTWENDPHALEPCINGGVSATGLYPSQEIEFTALERVAKKWKKEPNSRSRDSDK